MGEHDRAHAGIGRSRLQVCRHLTDELRGERIAVLRRVQREGRYRAIDVVMDELRH